MNKKGQKTAEKNDSTSFRVLQALESWSKYTTIKDKKVKLENHFRMDQRYLAKKVIKPNLIHQIC